MSDKEEPEIMCDEVGLARAKKANPELFAHDLGAPECPDPRDQAIRDMAKQLEYVKIAMQNIASDTCTGNAQAHIDLYQYANDTEDLIAACLTKHAAQIKRVEGEK